jgi:hypothetical protein
MSSFVAALIASGFVFLVIGAFWVWNPPEKRS